MKESILVIEAAQLMAAKRSDCVLVVDDEEHLSGIFTAKDLAYRVVANHLDTRSTTVSEIMTRGPMCVTADTSAQDALNLMVSRGFRHLPVCNEEGDIFGLLDITKCLYEALNKMERAYESSRKLYDALEGVEREWAKNSPAQFVQYMDALRDKMSCPDLTTVLDDDHPVVQVPVKAAVRDVAKLMKEYRTTAVLVMDHGGLAGIFTSKDIVLRVIAAGLVPDNCSVVRVMTPHPDVATTSTSILEALKKMHDGHYLNLPVLDEDRNICGLVDVLRLTYATLEQISSIEGNNNNNNTNHNNNSHGGPKFWDSITGGDHHLHDSDSVVSDSSRAFESPATPQPDDPHAAPALSANNYAASEDDERSSISLSPNTFSFKFADGAKTYRLRCEYNSLSALRHAVCNRLAIENKDDLTIAYRDDEDDEVLLTCDADVMDAVALARKTGHDRVKLIVHTALNKPPPPIITISEQPERTDPLCCSATSEEDISTTPTSSSSNSPTSDSEDGGLPYYRRRRPWRAITKKKNNDIDSTGDFEDVLLPAAITFLGVVILGVFTLGR
ncbi:hypothetical protein BJV82DRAFT_626072 [Fennellomyces sp. T-0311]|nr:hypothetical protein BJV82DRAFT_626072 [Fennellomyces sp. T-0311]